MPDAVAPSATVAEVLRWAAAGEPGAQPVYEQSTGALRWLPALRRVVVSSRSQPTEAAALTLARDIQKRILKR